MKMLEESAVAAVLLEYKHEGVDVEAVACHFKQRFMRRCNENKSFTTDLLNEV